ncbi:MAG: DUF1772 domain-containing protein [Myxococcota bacterium]
MQIPTRPFAFTLAFATVTAVAFIFLFLAVGLVPYWQDLSGPEVQAWWAGPFTHFPPMMAPLHLASIGAMVWAFVVHRREPVRWLWIGALLGLLGCQAFNFVVFGNDLNPALASGTLDEATALATLDRWDLLHTVRTALVLGSFACLAALSVRSPQPG